MEKTILNRELIKETLGISMAGVDKLLTRENDPIPSFRVGRRILIPVDGFRAWLARQTETNVNA